LVWSEDYYKDRERKSKFLFLWLTYSS
jgi:hypothetical protein